MGQAKLKRALGIEHRPRIQSVTVAVLAMANAADNGAPTVQLDFEDSAVQAIDFRMTPMDAMRLFDLLNRPYEDFWEKVTPADLAAAPEGRKSIACGGTTDIRVNVDTETGTPSFRLKFHDDAPIASIEFELPPRLAVAMMHGIAASAQQFGWIEDLKALKAAGKLN